MKILFEKYQGTGNDFVMLNNMDGKYDNLSIETIQFICHRRMGVGADGLIKINRSEDLDFEMDYYNADGTKSFCGNGARCAVSFAQKNGVFDIDQTTFSAIDGLHSAKIDGSIVSIKMTPVDLITNKGEDFILDTGSPHYIRFVDTLNKENIVETGKFIRYSDTFNKEGINVNLIERLSKDTIKILTYERGVEDETLSCGTGATASALVVGLKNSKIGKNTIHVHVKGGKLVVRFNYNGNMDFTDIELIGPAQFVFKGEMDV